MLCCLLAEIVYPIFGTRITNLYILSLSLIAWENDPGSSYPASLEMQRSATISLIEQYLSSVSEFVKT